MKLTEQQKTQYVTHICHEQAAEHFVSGAQGIAFLLDGLRHSRAIGVEGILTDDQRAKYAELDTALLSNIRELGTLGEEIRNAAPTVDFLLDLETEDTATQ